MLPPTCDTYNTKDKTQTPICKTKLQMIPTILVHSTTDDTSSITWSPTIILGPHNTDIVVAKSDTPMSLTPPPDDTTTLDVNHKQPCSELLLLKWETATGNTNNNEKSTISDLQWIKTKHSVRYHIIKCFTHYSYYMI